MKYRKFELKENINQLEYRTFRNKIEEMKPSSWKDQELGNLPIELFYDVLVTSAITSDWIMDVEEDNEYGEKTVWSWAENGLRYLNELPKEPKTNAEVERWALSVLERWTEIRSIDPN